MESSVKALSKKELMDILGIKSHETLRKWMEPIYPKLLEAGFNFDKYTKIFPPKASKIILDHLGV